MGRDRVRVAELDPTREVVEELVEVRVIKLENDCDAVIELEERCDGVEYRLEGLYVIEVDDDCDDCGSTDFDGVEVSEYILAEGDEVKERVTDDDN